MSTLAKAVHRGDDGSVHYLSSAVYGSTLVIADPALGKAVPIRLGGLCRLRSRTDDGHVEYEAIGTVYSTLVVVSPGGPPLIAEYGFCSSCMAGPHDYQLWPVCPSGGVAERVRAGTPPEVVTRDVAPPPLVEVPEPGPGPEPKPEPEPEPKPEPVRRGARPRSLFVASSEAVADVGPEEVEEPGRVLASRVWASGPLSKTQLRNGLPAASVDRYLQFAQDRNWLDVGREVVARGLVDPRPVDVTNLADVDGPSWGPDGLW